MDANFVPSFVRSNHLTRPYYCVADTLTTGVLKEKSFAENLLKFVNLLLKQFFSILSYAF